MTNKLHTPTPEFDFNCDLKFDPREVGGTGVWTYNSLSWDHGSVADILIRHPDSRYKQENGWTDALTQEVIKRWNSHAALVECVKYSLAQEEYKLEEGIKNPDVKAAVIKNIETMKAALALAKGE